MEYFHVRLIQLDCLDFTKILALRADYYMRIPENQHFLSLSALRAA